MKNPNCFVIIVALLILVSSVAQAFGKIIFNLSTDEYALLAFKQSITSDPYGVLTKNWSFANSNTSICYWIGVSCGIKHRRVTTLNVSSFELEGTIPPHFGNLTFLRSLDISSNDFTGLIPSELSKLRRLKEINVGLNNFSGEIPSWLGALSRLQHMYLNNNNFSGGFPLSLLNISKLQTLDMRSNFLDGNIPEEIGSLSKLRVLSLGYNDFKGHIPKQIGNLTFLEELYLHRNKLTEILPSLFNISSLIWVDLSDNELWGRIPSANYQSSQLEYIDLAWNNFTGSIPKHLRNLTSMKELGFYSNELEGELPQEIANLINLVEFSASENHLSGFIPPSIFNMSGLKKLLLGDNQFYGNLPSFQLINLEKLYVDGNKFDGVIPSSINNASKLNDLSMSNNSFSGSIPDFGNLRSLERLGLWGNNLSGISTLISSLSNCQNLTRLELAQNPLNSVLPTSIGNLSSSLLYFEAFECNIRGAIPSEFGNLSSLLYAHFYTNQITGSIPSTFGNLKQLLRLDLSNNQMQGHIPKEMCQLSRLGELDLGNNMLTHEIPECLGKLRSLKRLRLCSNKLNSTIPSSIWSLSNLFHLNLSSNYLSGQLSSQVGSLVFINNIDLSSNQLAGEIPSLIDRCESLVILDLSNNKFGGSIPESLNNNKRFEVLALQNNNLSGLIPKPLEDLSLRYFNVSNNKLHGEIPNGGCFVNFTAQSFVDNLGLCGNSTRFQVPPCSQNHGRSRPKSVARLIKFIVPVFISAIILVVIILIFIRRRNQQSALQPNVISLPEWKRISYMELEQGTSSFSETNLLGRGSFGSVFKGTLFDGLNVAVKVFNLQLEGAIKSFDTESKALSSIRHRNLVRVIGCCSNAEFKALILAYMSNGSLDKWLYSNNTCLNLIQRLDIAMDVASALEYLHHHHMFPVVHCDIKPSNILLDEDMTAHVGDFGISKLFDSGEATIQTKTLATFGYAAPEYGTEGIVSANGDVYSYGIVLLEMFTRKCPTNDMFSDEMSLKFWVGRALQENAIIDVLDPALLTTENQHFSAKEHCVSSIFELAMKCLVVSPEERINMIEVGAVLRRIKAKFVLDTTVQVR